MQISEWQRGVIITLGQRMMDRPDIYAVINIEELRRRACAAVSAQPSRVAAIHVLEEYFLAYERNAEYGDGQDNLDPVGVDIENEAIGTNVAGVIRG